MTRLRHCILALVLAVSAMFITAAVPAHATGSSSCFSTSYRYFQGTTGDSYIYDSNGAFDCTAARGTSDTALVYAEDAQPGVVYYLFDYCGTAGRVALTSTPLRASRFYGIAGFLYARANVAVGPHVLCFSSLDGSQSTSAVVYIRTAA